MSQVGERIYRHALIVLIHRTNHVDSCGNIERIALRATLLCRANQDENSITQAESSIHKALMAFVESLKTTHNQSAVIYHNFLFLPYDAVLVIVTSK